jgi:ubiquinone/menaquinone biosynthesis C-methylase UbiE
MTDPHLAQATFAQSSFAELYERWLVAPLFKPWVDDLLDRARLLPRDRVLDIACGTGIVARTARERLGPAAIVVGVDASAQMLAVARSLAPDIEWRQGNAVSLPVGERETFDVILCQQGLQFFPDKTAAAREMYRVMAPKGRLAVATWRPLDELPLVLALHRVAERHLGSVTDRRHAYGDAAAIQQLFVEAGFSDVRVDTVSRRVRFDDPAPFLRMNAMALIGMSAQSDGMDDETRARLADTIAAESIPALDPFKDGAAVAFEMKANVATGHR